MSVRRRKNRHHGSGKGSTFVGRGSCPVPATHARKPFSAPARLPLSLSVRGNHCAADTPSPPSSPTSRFHPLPQRLPFLPTAAPPPDRVHRVPGIHHRQPVHAIITAHERRQGFCARSTTNQRSQSLTPALISHFWRVILFETQAGGRDLDSSCIPVRWQASFSGT